LTSSLSFCPDGRFLGHRGRFATGTHLKAWNRREFLLCASLAAGLVAFRSIVFTLYEQNFDSDQAVVGLMAKHLSELRAFPLFYYGQNYMLGVQAWIAVPFFWIGGPTLAMLRLPLLLINVGVVVLLMVAFARRGVKPILGFVATLPIIITVPVISGELLATLGASVEPFLYVLLLWVLRKRPVAFGALLCIGTLHREFTIFALPALAIAAGRDRRAWSSTALAKGAAAFIIVWLLIDLLKRHVNAYGPAGGVRATGSLTSEAKIIWMWLSFRADPYLARLRDVVAWGLPDMFGIRPHTLLSYGAPSSLSEGSRLAGGALVTAAFICAARLLWLVGRGEKPCRADGTQFCLYLALVGIQAVLAYGLNGSIIIGPSPVLRYLLFALFLPVALFGAYFQLESKAIWRGMASLLIVVWALSNVRDNARFLHEFVVTPPPSYHRILADYLAAHRIKYGRARYWDCYVVDFLARERVILASTDTVRISAYQAQVDLNSSNAVTLERMPCDQGKRVSVWCLSDPFDR
jgi:hypothetical protein